MLADMETCIANYKQHVQIVEATKAKIRSATSMDSAENEHTDNADLSGLKQGSLYVSTRRMAPVAYTWGQCLLDQHRYAEAMGVFKFVGRLNFPFDSILLRCALCHIGLGEFDDALEILYELTKIEPFNIELFILRAKIYRHLGNVDFANIDLQKANHIDPTHVELPALRVYAVTKAVIYKNKASKHILEGESGLIPAVHALTSAIELDRNDWLSYYKRGICMCDLGQFESAIQDLYKVLENPDRDTSRDAEVRERIASVYNLAGIKEFEQYDLDSAIQSFTAGLDHCSAQATLWKNRGDCFLRIGDAPRALEDYAQAVELDPQDVACRERCGILWSDMASKRLLEGAWEDAVLMWSTALQYDPEPAPYYYKRAKAHFMGLDIEEARRDLKEAVRRDPTNVEYAALSSQLVSGAPLSDLTPFRPQRMRKVAVPYAHVPDKEGGLPGKSIQIQLNVAPPVAAPNMIPRPASLSTLFPSIPDLNRRISPTTRAVQLPQPCHRNETNTTIPALVAESVEHVLSLPPRALPKLTVKEGGPHPKQPFNKDTSTKLRSEPSLPTAKASTLSETRKTQRKSSRVIHQVDLSFNFES
ncbi:hypothetical protein DFS34DRAFT_628553 [Phlyctochytrium arcticum]|nr:hypothetical protein DFS34DRAFT_628553 [Phlyctochytrium arcticum]